MTANEFEAARSAEAVITSFKNLKLAAPVAIEVLTSAATDAARTATELTGHVVRKAATTVFTSRPRD